MTNKFRDALELFPRTGSSVETLGRFQFDFTSTIKQALTIAAALQDAAETLRGLDDFAAVTDYLDASWDEWIKNHSYPGRTALGAKNLKAAQAIKTARSTPPADAMMREGCSGISYNGVQLWSDRETMKKLRQDLHEARTVPQLKKEILELRAALSAPALDKGE